MSPRVWIVSCFAATCCVAEEKPPQAIRVAEPPAKAADPMAETVYSKSRQFRVSAGDSLSRGTMALLAEDAKDELLQLTGEKDEWKVPVGSGRRGSTILLRGPAAVGPRTVP